MSSYFLLFTLLETDENIILKKFSNYGSCKKYINELKELSVNDIIKYQINSLVDKVTHNLMDGYYITNYDKKKFKFIMKKTEINPGYLYNSANINIKEIGSLHIINFIEEKYKQEKKQDISYNDVIKELKKKYNLIK